MRFAMMCHDDPGSTFRVTVQRRVFGTIGIPMAETAPLRGPYGPLSMTFPRPVLMRIHVLAIALAAATAAIPASQLSAQTPAAAPASGSVLSLADAIALAKRSNPSLQTSVNARRTAAAVVRAANGAFLPSVNTSFSTGYREGRQSIFEGQAFGSANDQLSSNASGSASLNLSLDALNSRRAAKSSQEATESDIAAAEQRVRNNVTTQYLTALQAQANAALQDTLVSTTAVQLQLAQARLQVGSGTLLDVQQAEVANGQQRVAALRQRNQAAIEIIRLFQQIGVEPIAGVVLDNNLPATPTVDMSSLMDMARKSNPQLEAFRARQKVAGYNAAAARSTYFPSLSLSAGVSGNTIRYTNTGLLMDEGRAGAAQQKAGCIRSEEVRAAVGLSNNLAQCASIAFTPADEALIRTSQGKYPFAFTRNPYNLNAQLSLPIFNGFRREQQIEQAAVQRKNAENDVRIQEIAVSADVSAASLQLTTAQQTVTLQEQNVRTARTALSLAQERYRVGLASIVDLQQARGNFERAETDRITAVYDVQRAFTTLEAAVGRPLR